MGAPENRDQKDRVTLRPGVRAVLPRVDTIVFDVDGVLLDVRDSIRQVNILSVPAFLRSLPGWTAFDDLLCSEDIECFKRAGGFNDDWDLTCAVVLLYLFKAARYRRRDATYLHPLAPTVADFTDAIAARGGWLSAAEAIVWDQTTPEEQAVVRSEWDQKRVLRLFQEMWAGDLSPRLYGFTPQFYPGKGAIRNDRPLVDLRRIPGDKTLAVLTGRTLEEARVALEKVGLDSRISLPGVQGVTKNDGFYKPEPEGMRTLLTRLGARVALYIGDALDDLRTVLAFRTLPESAHITLLSAQVLTGTAGTAGAPLFAQADIVADDVNLVLDLLKAA